MKCYEGHIITCDSENHIYRYLIEKDGKIAFVGNDLPTEYREAKLIQLGNKALLPSFVDSHIHFASFATFHAGLNVMNARTNQKIVQMLGVFKKQYTGKIIIGFGASPYSVEEGKLVSRVELDQVCPDKPVMIVKYDGHACVVNTALLKKIDHRIKNLRGYHPDTGEMNQEAFFAVSDYITNAIPISELIHNMQKAIDYIAAKGIGMVHTVSGVGFLRDLDVDLERYVGRSAQSGFQMRLFFQTLSVKNTLKRKLPRVGGCFKTALDGCFGSMDAAISDAYIGTKNKGVLYYSDEEVIAFCKEANRANLQIEMHAIGDRAFDQATKAIAAALEEYPRNDHRHGIIHACMPTKEGLERCEKYNIQIPLQTAFINWPQEPDSYLSSILGEERSTTLNPLRMFSDYGIHFSAGSDGPCTDPDPILWIHNACNHSNKQQALSIYEALRMCTYEGCYASFDEQQRGTLEVGKIADMVVLSQSPYDVKREELNTIKVEQLLLNGVPYTKQKQGIIKLLCKGILSKRVKI